MIRLRAHATLAALAAALSACSAGGPAASTTPRRAEHAPMVLATFTGSYDPATGKLTIETEASAAANALTVLDPWSDGSTGHNPANTFELRNGTGTPGVGSGCSSGNPRSFGGNIAIQSFFRNQAFEDVYAEILEVTPSGYAGCNSNTAPPPGVAGAYGIWSYGTIGRAGSATDDVERAWHFRYTTDAAFGFRGRILGNLAAPEPLVNGPEFDWTPTSIVYPARRTFVPAPFPFTTVAHIVWDGTNFVDVISSVTFTRQGGSVASVTSGLDGTRYGTFPGGAYWLEDPDVATTSHFDLSGDFTICAKIKPGVVPPTGQIKAVVAKGNPAITPAVRGIERGWALAEMFDEYAFQYRTAADPTTGENFTYVGPAAMFANTVPPTYAYDFICGGRAGNDLWVKAHGGEERGVATTSGSFDGLAYPLAIGAYSDGLAPAGDVGVYEIIIDSRAPMPNVMHELVGTAEGYQLRGWLGTGRATSVDFEDDAARMATYAPFDPTLNVTYAQVGLDGNVHILPPFASTVVVSDGSGLLPEGALVHYLHPVFEVTAVGSTSGSGFCIGAEVVANRNTSWADVHGTIFSFEHTSMAVHVNPFTWVGESGFFAGYTLPAGTAGWEPGTVHVFKVCADPHPTDPVTALYVDDVYATGSNAVNPVSGPLPNLADPTSALAIGAEARSRAFGGAPTVAVAGDGGPLTNARIRRVFICPDPTYNLCN